MWNYLRGALAFPIDRRDSLRGETLIVRTTGQRFSPCLRSVSRQTGVRPVWVPRVHSGSARSDSMRPRERLAPRARRPAMREQ